MYTTVGTSYSKKRIVKNTYGIYIYIYIYIYAQIILNYLLCRIRSTHFCMRTVVETS